MLNKLLEKMISREDLTAEEACEVMCEIMAGTLKESQIAAYLVALRCKGESAAEILGSCRAIRRFSVQVQTCRSPVVDTCGTGGDSSGTFNISTTSAFVTSGAGAVVAKHGNRAVSSRSGSAELLEALGVNIELPLRSTEECLDRAGIAFLFAPLMHPSMAHAAPARKALGLRTIFNILGPLNNPAGARRQVIGVYDARLGRMMAEVLQSLGVDHAMLVWGEDGTDEITTTGSTGVVEVKPGSISTYRICPENYGISRVPLQALAGGDARQSARICRGVLSGEKGPQRDVVLMNSGAALYVSGIAESLAEGIELAKKSIDSGAAMQKLRFLQDYSRNYRAFHEEGMAYA